MTETMTFFCLTSDQDPDYYREEEYDDDSWMEDKECQENTFLIIPLSPEETTIDKDNHIHTTFHFFFKELGYFTEEPEPIDPDRDYEQEARTLLDQRNKKIRQEHINGSIDFINQNY
ncbi:hypothetical protein G6F37_001412 [Rhizopus arrhizus]|nr:hypothetical protein G6F38_000631 [Rhizopus arrhizus]KAG1163221.1 hypothetical protein G6F37_001412 [Rhizopus arrhizus]